jgi:acyl-coenzyme A thioesterase PaaI-like protein
MTVIDGDAFALSPAQQELYDSALNGGFTRWSGVRMLELRRGFARLGLSPRPEMLTPWGTLNGSVLNSLVEIPAFFALLTELSPQELPVTNDIFLQHVRPLPGDAAYELTGTLLRKGKSMAWLEATVLADGKPCTFARLTKTLVARSG